MSIGPDANVQYGLTQDQLDLREMIRDLAIGRIAACGAIDQTGELPQDICELLASHDLLALPFEERCGGTPTRCALGSGPGQS